MSDPLKVLFVVSEAAPLIKVGGLGDVGGTLPQALLHLPPERTDGRALDVRIVIPYHNELKQKNVPVTHLADYSVPYQNRYMPVSVYSADGMEAPIYLIDGEPIRNIGVYSSDSGAEVYKYTFFSVAALQMCKAINWRPEILHAHDWHSACAVMKLTQLASYDPFFRGIKKLYTIHNLPYSGGSYPNILADFDVRQAFDPDFPDWSRSLPMALGLSTADRISTVSETYAKEIRTEGFGHGYQHFLQIHQDKVCGIVNGLFPEQWDPAHDPVIYTAYDKNNLSGKARNKSCLQAEVGLPQESDTPLFVMIGRLDGQKGIDLCTQALRKMRDCRWQAIILGTGNPGIENDLRALAMEFPNRVRTEIRFDAPFSRKMYAGGDILLMPSRYEPCGIAQMIAMRYGTIPVAHATGGLRDTIDDPNETADYSGFLFENATVEDAEHAMRRSLDYYRERENWIALQRRCMEKDFSWEKSAGQYFDLYGSL